MQATVVMLIALGGLGCQNPVSDLPPFLPDVRQSVSQPSTKGAKPGHVRTLRGRVGRLHPDGRSAPTP